MPIRSAVFVTLALAMLLPTALLSADNDLQIRVTIERRDQIRQLQSMGLDIVQAEPESVEIITTPAEAASLQQLGFKVETVHESVSAYYRSRLPQKDQGGYKTLSELYAYVDAMIAAHPTLVSPRQSIGKTIEDRDIWAVKISDNPTVDEDEPEVLYTAAIHCREVATPEVLLYFMDYLTNQYGIDPDVQDLVDNREIWFVVMCNPDGYYYNEITNPGGGGLWRRNRRLNYNGTYGVDLNRNFGYQWGYDDIGSSPVAGSDTYRGSGPFSEPETQALRDFEIAHEFVLSVYYHSYANIFIFPWGYVQRTCPDDDLYRAMGDTVNAMTGYLSGLVADLLYPANGGSFDWEYAEQTTKNKILGTTIEVGRNSDGFWPTLPRLAVIKQENLQPLLFLTRLAGNVNSLRPPTAPVFTGLPEWTTGDAYTVTWSDTDPDNPGVQYELTELQKGHIVSDPGDNLNAWSALRFAPSTVRAYSGASSFHTGLADLDASHLTSVYPYTVKAGDHLTFQTFLDLEFYHDFAYVEVSTDGRNFESIPGNLTSNFDPYGTNRGNGISGSSDGGWIEADFDLAAFIGQQLWFRFTLETDTADLGEGWYLDEIYPHLVFDQVTTISSTLTEPSFDFTDRPMGKYYYQVRSRDAQEQWSNLSVLGAIDVLGAGIGDVDLDGIAGSVADLAAFSLYFEQGLPAFRFYPEMQTGETDVNCDDLTLTAADLVELAEIVIGASSPCYASPVPSERLTVEAASHEQGSAGLAAGAASFAVNLEAITFTGEDTVLVEVALTDADSPLLGFQFRIEYDATALNLSEVRAGDAIPGWQHFDYRSELNGEVGEVTLASVARFQGPDITAGDIDLLPTPATLATLKFVLAAPSEPLSSPVSFFWENCGDNAIVCGAFDGSTLVVDSMALSRQVRDADGSDVSGIDARYGGADYTCLYGLFGGGPTRSVDFMSTRVVSTGGCCVGQVGDVNGEGGEAPTIGDISMLIDHLFVSGVELPCLDEADVNQSGGTSPADEDITIGDISMLIDHLFISQAELPACM